MLLSDPNPFLLDDIAIDIDAWEGINDPDDSEDEFARFDEEWL